MVLKGILRPGKRVQQEFGDVVDVMRTERIPVGQSAEAGARKMASAREADAILAEAQQAGASAVTPREIVSQFGPLRDEVKRRAANANPDAASQMQEIVARAKTLKAGGSHSLVENQALKRQAQSDASAAFRAQDKGATIKDTTAKLDKAVAVGRQKAAETRAPAVKAVNQRTKNLMGLEEALEDAEARSGAGIMNLNPLSWLGNMVPSGASRMTFAADAAAQGTQGTQAKLIRQALLSLLAGDGAPSPE
jgi:aminopeptidase N